VINKISSFLKDFLKCTPITHPDNELLMKAQKEVHNLAEKIDQVQKEVNESYGIDNQSCLQIIQDLIENIDENVNKMKFNKLCHF
jgi:methyl-accepting chemotaxis protein